MFLIAFLLPTGAYSATCLSPFGMASGAEKDSFKSDPQSILASNPSGGGVLARSTRELLLGETQLYDPILSIVTNANAQQQSAIGVGFGQAVLACSRVNPTAAQEISVAVIARAPQDMVNAFSATVKDVETLAVGGSPSAAAAPGLNGAAVIGTNGGPGGLDESVAQTAVAFSNPHRTAQFSPSSNFSTGDGSSGGGSTPPVATVPGPTVGEGPLAMMASIVAMMFFYHRRNKRHASQA
ncbi:hypothetical protein ASG25_02900 [Rhizobium sp. Leaf384]|nr:hypothetical protein ASG25_02900 [Rhizobium sp. Leaf384]KQS86598.1 hypothetical protein ASG58_17975 [Rhizobium sp. Leaf383]